MPDEFEHLLKEVMRDVDGESVVSTARASASGVAVTDRRIIVINPPRRVALIPFTGLRRIQFDVEKDRPATLVLVPDDATEPHYLLVSPEEYEHVANVIAAIGQHLASLTTAKQKESA